MIGAIAGDIIGSMYEWKNIRHTDFPRKVWTVFQNDGVTIGSRRGIKDAPVF